ncbi:transposase [Streptomyces mirabilis]|uniref:transposase n=1 Tax=Streptomyces mirabilis TaxID=68239 RepID=UPI002256284A|nr:transposase [Streptomyces mirabilis]MCX4428729.1 transposase [Streptomyces mirabilis]
MLDLRMGRTPARVASSSGTVPEDPDRLGRPGQAAAERGLPRCRDGCAGDGQPPNTHGIASLYEAFEPEEAFALAQRLEIHHTPKHGSWLNIAEIELSALTRQCLDRRIGDLDTLNTELSAWQNATNTDQRQVDWQFTTHDARIKLRHLYPRN